MNYPHLQDELKKAYVIHIQFVNVLFMVKTGMCMTWT